MSSDAAQTAVGTASGNAGLRTILDAPKAAANPAARGERRQMRQTLTFLFLLFWLVVVGFYGWLSGAWR